MIHRTLASIALTFCALATAGAQAERDIRIRNFDALLTVHPDGNLDVVETLTFHFDGHWNGVNRDLSLHHYTAQGRATKLDVEDGAVTDASGQPLVVEYQRMNSGWTRRYHIYIPGAEAADRTIVIRYRVHNAIRF